MESKGNNEDRITQNGAIVVRWMLFWYISTIALFGLFYANVSARFADEEHLAKVLGNIGWPFAMLSVAVPITYVLSTNLKNLLDLKKSIDNAPRVFEDARVKLEEFQSTLGEAGNDLEARIAKLNALIEQMGDKEDRFSRIMGQRVLVEPKALETGITTGEITIQATAQEKLATYLETASDTFYEALEKANTDGRRTRNTLVVKPGGANRPDIVENLRAGKYFDRNEARNNALADFIGEVFRVEMFRRSRKPLTEALMTKLDELRLAAETLGASF